MHVCLRLGDILVSKNRKKKNESDDSPSNISALLSKKKMKVPHVFARNTFWQLVFMYFVFVFFLSHVPSRFFFPFDRLKWRLSSKSSHFSEEELVRNAFWQLCFLCIFLYFFFFDRLKWRLSSKLSHFRERGTCRLAQDANMQASYTCCLRPHTRVG
jgi:hypothetical protein